MKRFVRPRKLVFVMLAALAMVLAIDGPSQARGMGGHGVGGGHPEGRSGFEGHHDFDGHHGFEGHHLDRDGDGRSGFGIGPIVPGYGYYPPAYGYDPAAPLFDPAPTPAPAVVYPLSPAAVYPLSPVPPTPAVEPAPEITLPTGRWERHGDGVSSPHVWVWIPTYAADLSAPETQPSQPTSRPVR
jgi:hypothetical protein